MHLCALPCRTNMFYVSGGPPPFFLCIAVVTSYTNGINAGISRSKDFRLPHKRADKQCRAIMCRMFRKARDNGDLMAV